MKPRSLLLLAMVVALGAAGAVAWRAIVTAPPAPAAAVSEASAASGQQKVQGLDQARSRASQSRQPVPATETFTDAELSSMANEKARALGLPLSHLVLHSNPDGTLAGEATVQVVGQDFPVSLKVTPSVTNGTRLSLTVTSVELGALPLPAPVTDQITKTVDQALNLGLVPDGFRDVHVRITNGQVTVSGVATPTG